MLQVGITGGIGSGKTTVCHIFETLGIPVYYADDRAKWLMEYNPEVKGEIVNLFGAQAYDDSGKLQRKHIAEIAFHDPSVLSKLNAIVHPAVWRDGEEWNKNQAATPYTLKEAALLYESGGSEFLDFIIIVSAPEEIRVNRVVQRDQATKEEVLARIRRQMPEEEKISRADFIILNDGQKALIPQVLSIHRQLLEKAALISSK